jgi:hypothetical protein
MYSRKSKVKLADSPEKLNNKVNIILIKDKKTKLVDVFKIEERDNNFEYYDTVFKAVLFSFDGTYSIVTQINDELYTSFVTPLDIEIIDEERKNK